MPPLASELHQWVTSAEQRWVNFGKRLSHALKGEWQGYRAIRLSDAYRAIYIVRENGSVETVWVEEVNKHDYY
jgi:mRNA-degrading endonuclease YafQ of YafQ-DinJ toxin-antitoxin module